MRSEVRARQGHWGQWQRLALWEAKRRALCRDCLSPSQALLIVLCLIFQMKNLYHILTPLKVAGHKIGAPASGTLAVEGEWAITQGVCLHHSQHPPPPT